MPTTSGVDYETLSSEARYLTSETETTSSQSMLPEQDISKENNRIPNASR